MPITVPIDGDNEGLRNSLSDSESDIQDWGAKITGIGGKASLAFVAIGTAVEVVTQHLASLYEQADKNNQAQEQVASILKVVGERAGWSASQLELMTDKYSDLSNVSHEVVSNVEKVALGFGKVRGENFEQLIALSLDVSKALGEDASTAAKKLGESLEDPTKAAENLASIYIELSEEQKKALEDMHSLGRTSEAQAEILRLVSEAYGGTSKTQKSFFDQQKRLHEMFVGVSETLLSALVPALEAVEPLLEALAIGAENLVGWLLNTEGSVYKLATSIYEGLKVALDWLIDAGVVVFSYFQTIVQNWAEYCNLQVMSFQLGLITLAERVKYLFIEVLPPVFMWLGTSTIRIFTDIGNFTATIFTNILKNAWEFVKGIGRALRGDAADFKFHSLLEGFELTITELPKIAKRVVSEEEKVLQGAIAEADDRLKGKYEENFVRNRAAFDAAFVRPDIGPPKPTAPPDEPPKPPDEGEEGPDKKKKKEEDKKKKTASASHSRRAKEFKEDKDSEGGVEDFLSLSSRIQGAASANKAEERAAAARAKQLDAANKQLDLSAKQLKAAEDTKDAQKLIADGVSNTNAHLKTIADALKDPAPAAFG